MTTYLVDTNVLLRFVLRSNPSYPATRRMYRTLRQRGDRLSITSQNCIEFWNVATRPFNRNGLGLSVNEVRRQLRFVERTFPLLLDTPDVYTIWRQLVVAYGVSGVQVHDAHLVAAMLANGITHILTFNAADFTRYTGAGIVVVDPESI